MSQSKNIMPVLVGTMVSTVLYNRGRGYITAIYGEQQPETIRTLCRGSIRIGGRAEFDIVFESGHISKRLPESILHGVQWTIFDADVGFADSEHLQHLLDNAEQIRLAAEKKAEEEATLFAEKVQMLRTSAAYADLEQGNESGGTLAAKNIRKLLKKHFPTTKFSVRKSHWGAIVVEWKNGPKESAVEEWTSRFINRTFDLHSDCERYVSSPWTEVFGSAGYISLYGR